MERWLRALDVVVTRMWPFLAGPRLFDRRTWQSPTAAANRRSVR
jgi:hypothetical protein